MAINRRDSTLCKFSSWKEGRCEKEEAMPRARVQVILVRWFWLLAFLGVVVVATPSSMAPPLLQIPIGKTITANWSTLENNQPVENKVIHVALISCGPTYRSLTFNAIKSIVLSSRGSATIRFHILVSPEEEREAREYFAVHLDFILFPSFAETKQASFSWWLHVLQEDTIPSVL